MNEVYFNSPFLLMPMVGMCKWSNKSISSKSSVGTLLGVCTSDPDIVKTLIPEVVSQVIYFIHPFKII